METLHSKGCCIQEALYLSVNVANSLVEALSIDLIAAGLVAPSDCTVPRVRACKQAPAFYGRIIGFLTCCCENP